MPPLTRRFIKVALVYLVAALLIGIALTLRSLWELPAVVAALTPIYFHLFMVGWVTNLIFGVVYWMFPKFSKDRPHGHEGLWQATFWLLTLGLALRVIAEPLQAVRPEMIWSWLLALAAIGQWLAGIIFVANTWGRVKGR